MRFIVSGAWVGSILLGGSLPCLAAPSGSDAVRVNPLFNCLSESDFERLAVETAPKVNLFKEVWAADPEAEFFGGTSRDYLYWLIGQFKWGDCAETIAKLKALKAIDVREFLHADSDVDVITDFSLADFRASGIRPDQYGIRKLDPIPREILNPKSDEGRNELNQGYIPVEKIRIGQKSVKSLFKDGLTELYSGHLTVKFADERMFWRTLYARVYENHPILLVLRYIRVLSQDYYQRWGTNYSHSLEVDPVIAAQMKAIVDSVSDGRALDVFFTQSRFTTWFNASLSKAFRSSTNPTATMDLIRRFKIDRLVTLYPEIHSINPYLFFKRRDEAAIAAEFKALGFDPTQVYVPMKKVFPTGELFHGAGSEEAFRGILLEGILPSTGGTGGEGVYGVSASNIMFAAAWGESGDRIVVLDLDPNTRVVDITEGEGRRLWSAYTAANGGFNDHEDFCERFGIDLLKYPYHSDAYVLKNSAVIRGMRGHTRSVEPLSVLLRRVAALKTVEEFVEITSQYYRVERTAFETQVFRAAIRELKFLPEAVNGLPVNKRIDLLLTDPFLEDALIPFKSDPKFIAKYLDEMLSRYEDLDERAAIFTRFDRVIRRIRANEKLLPYKVKDIPFREPMRVMSEILSQSMERPSWQKATAEAALRRATKVLPIQRLFGPKNIDPQLFKEYIFTLVRYFAETEFKPEASPFDDSGSAQELLSIVLSLDYSDHAEKSYRQPEVIRALKWGPVERLPQGLIWALIFNPSVMDQGEREILIEKHFIDAVVNERYQASEEFMPAALFDLPLDLIVERMNQKGFVSNVVRTRFFKTFRSLLQSYPTLKPPAGLGKDPTADADDCSGLLTG